MYYAIFVISYLHMAHIGSVIPEILEGGCFPPDPRYAIQLSEKGDTIVHYDGYTITSFRVSIRIDCFIFILKVSRNFIDLLKL